MRRDSWPGLTSVARYSFTEPDNVTVTETHFCELGETGISSFQDNPREAARFVSSSSCVRDSVERIPAERRSQSRLELLSTAGMRVLRLKSPAVAEEILGNLTQELGQVGDMQAEAGILGGVEEAVAGGNLQPPLPATSASTDEGGNR